MPRKLLILASVGALSVLLSASTPPPPSHAESAYRCPACTSATRCELVVGHGSTGCSVTVLTGCTEELGICVCGNCGGYTADTPANRLERDTPFGRLVLRPVGDDRYVAWSCDGTLIVLAERDAQGRVRDLDVEPFVERYRYDRVAGNDHVAE